MENTVNDVQVPIVEAQEDVSAQIGGTEVQHTEITVREQSREENAHFRRMRLENERLKSENERYAAEILERQMAEDLALIRVMDPEVSSLEALGEDFAALIAAGVSAPVAFAAVRESKRASLPPSMGAVDVGSAGEKTFYSPEEVDKLTSSQLADPSIWARVRESMTKW